MQASVIRCKQKTQSAQRTGKGVALGDASRRRARLRRHLCSRGTSWSHARSRADRKPTTCAKQRTSSRACANWCRTHGVGSGVHVMPSVAKMSAELFVRMRGLQFKPCAAANTLSAIRIEKHITQRILCDCTQHQSNRRQYAHEKLQKCKHMASSTRTTRARELKREAFRLTFILSAQTSPVANQHTQDNCIVVKACNATESGQEIASSKPTF